MRLSLTFKRVVFVAFFFLSYIFILVPLFSSFQTRLNYSSSTTTNNNYIIPSNNNNNNNNGFQDDFQQEQINALENHAYDEFESETKKNAKLLEREMAREKANWVDGFVAFRFISNDYIPYESNGVQLRNLRQILIRERALTRKFKKHFKNIWVLDRLRDEQSLEKVKKTLAEFGQLNNIMKTSYEAAANDKEAASSKYEMSSTAEVAELHKLTYKSKRKLQEHFHSKLSSDWKWYTFLSVHHTFTIESMTQILNDLNNLGNNDKNKLAHFVFRCYNLNRPIPDHMRLVVNVKSGDDAAYLDGTDNTDAPIGFVSQANSVIFHRRKGKKVTSTVKYGSGTRTDFEMMKHINCLNNPYLTGNSGPLTATCRPMQRNTGFLFSLYTFPSYSSPYLVTGNQLSSNLTPKLTTNVNANAVAVVGSKGNGNGNDTESEDDSCPKYVLNYKSGGENSTDLYRPNQKNPKFVVYRIYGNDMPPLQKKGQLYGNLKFTLVEESKVFPGLTKRFVLNRILDKDIENRMLELLQDFGYTEENGGVLRFPFEHERVFKNLPDDPAILVHYAQHLNECRNKVLSHARATPPVPDQPVDGTNVFDWIMVFDGNQFITDDGWKEMKESVTHQGNVGIQHFSVPMCRIMRPQENTWLNKKALVDDVIQSNACFLQEPQLMFRYDSCQSFDENNQYGKRSKLQLLNNLGCGVDSRDSQCGTAGYVFRLFPFPDTESDSDAIQLITDHSKRYRLRKKTIELFNSRILNLYDQLNGVKNPRLYNPSLSKTIVEEVMQGDSKSSTPSSKNNNAKSKSKPKPKPKQKQKQQQQQKSNNKQKKKNNDINNNNNNSKKKKK